MNDLPANILPSDVGGKVKVQSSKFTHTEDIVSYNSCNLLKSHSNFLFKKNSAIDDFRGACAVMGNVQVAGRTSSVSTTTEMLSTHDVTFKNIDGSLFHI